MANGTTDFQNQTGGLLIDNITTWSRCPACADAGLAFYQDGSVAAPCPLCREGERWERVWAAEPRRYGPPVSLPLAELVTGPVE